MMAPNAAVGESDPSWCRREARGRPAMAPRPGTPPWHPGRTLSYPSALGQSQGNRRRQQVEHFSRYGAATLVIAGIALLAVLELHLLVALLAGLLIYELADGLAARLRSLGLAPRAGKAVALTVVL